MYSYIRQKNQNTSERFLRLILCPRLGAMVADILEEEETLGRTMWHHVTSMTKGQFNPKREEKAKGKKQMVSLHKLGKTER